MESSKAETTLMPGTLVEVTHECPNGLAVFDTVYTDPKLKPQKCNFFLIRKGQTALVLGQYVYDFDLAENVILVLFNNMLVYARSRFLKSVTS